MKLTKEIFNISKIASTDVMRANLNNVHITPKYIEATNGHMLVRVQIEDGIEALFPAKLFTSAAKGARKGELVKVEKSEGDKCCGDTYSFTVQGELASSTNLRDQSPSMSAYPDTDQVLPKGPFKTEIGFSPAYMEVIAKTAKQLGIKCLRMKVGEGCQPMRIEDEANPENFFILMPMRLDK